MKSTIKITILSFLFLACNSTITKQKSERFFPEKKGLEKFDTIVANNQIQIIILKTDLDSFVTNKYEIEGHTQIDKYRDAEIRLTIKQNAQTILDTVLRKQQFSKFADNEFMNIAIFHNYWFRNLDENKIELFGVIGQPETDYTLSFHHYFDLVNRKLIFVEDIDSLE